MGVQGGLHWLSLAANATESNSVLWFSTWFSGELDSFCIVRRDSFVVNRYTLVGL